MEKCKIVFEKIQALLLSASELTQKYCLTFKKEDFFTFSDAKKRNSLYKKEYVSFICKINELSVPLGDRMAEISSLLLEADREADDEKISVLNSVFQKYLIFEKELFIFTDTTEKELEKGLVSVSVMSESANRLLVSIKAFYECLA